MPDPDLRDRLVAALGDVRLRLGPNTLAMAQRGEAIRLSGNEKDDVADMLVGIVQPEFDQWAADCQKYTDLATGAERTRQIHKADADQYEEQLRAEIAGLEETTAGAQQNAQHWQERAETAEATIERRKRTNRMVNGGAREARLRAEAAEQQLATVRAYAEDLYTAPQKVSACGVRERLLDILTPAGPARTIEEAMAGAPVTPKPCPERVVHPAHTWEQGRRDHHCSGDPTYTNTKEA